VKCAFRANEGLLYPLEKQFIFIHKPPILIRFNEVESVEFQRYAGGQGSTRNFDLCVSLKGSAASLSNQQEYVFSGIDRSDYTGLYNFLTNKNLRIKNIEGISGIVEQVTRAPVYNEDEIYGGPDDGMDEESDDEDYDEKAAAEDAEEDSDDSDMSDADEDVDDDDFGSEIDDDLDSDLDEARGGGGDKPKKKKKTNDDDENDSLDSPKKKKRKKKVADSLGGKKKAKKDPNQPKGAKSAYIIYSSEHRDRINKENPGLSFGDLQRIIGASYKNLGEDELAELQKKASQDKERHAREMKAYKPPKGEEKSGGKKKKIKDPNAPKRPVTSFMLYSSGMRPIVKKEKPDIKFGEMGKLLGEKWREISPVEKEKYEALANKDKERYNKEMAEYKSKKKVEDDEDDSDGIDEDGDSDDNDDDEDEDE